MTPLAVQYFSLYVLIVHDILQQLARRETLDGSHSGMPIPAAFKSSAVGFPLLQQSRTLPFTTTVGTQVTPYSFALSIPFSFKL
jgi:hypothetical protein